MNGRCPVRDPPDRTFNRWRRSRSAFHGPERYWVRAQAWWEQRSRILTWIMAHTAVEIYPGGERRKKMPIFEYRCEDCGHRFDAFFRRSEDAEKESPACERCGSRRVRKLFSLLGMGGGSRESFSGGCATRST